jgi:4-hydroxybenzoyl-CoA reductase subunit alpha
MRVRWSKRRERARAAHKVVTLKPASEPFAASASACRSSTASRRSPAAPSTPPTCPAGALVGKILRSPGAPCRIARSRRLRRRAPARRASPSSPARTATCPTASCRSRRTSSPWRAARCATSASRWPPSRRWTSRPPTQALKLIRLHVRELPIYRERRPGARAGAALLHDNKPGNIEREVHNEFGNAAEGFAAAHLIREQTYQCAEVTHAQMEPHAAMASYDASRGHLTLWSVSMVPYYVHLRVAQCLGWTPRACASSSPTSAAASARASRRSTSRSSSRLLARAAGGTVRMQLTREESILTHRGRPESDTRMKLGMTRDGRITACECRGGAARRRLRRLRHHHHPLRRRADQRPLRRARREVRRLPRLCQHAALRRHARPRHGQHPHRLRVADDRDGRSSSASTRSRCGGATCCPARPTPSTACASSPTACPNASTRSRRPAAGASAAAACRSGIGASAWPARTSSAARPSRCTSPASRTRRDGAQARLRRRHHHPHRRLRRRPGLTTIVAQVVAEVLGVDWRRVRVISNDSAMTPKDNGSYSSRVTFMVGNACLDAANKLKQALVEAAGAASRSRRNRSTAWAKFQVAGDPTRFPSASAMPTAEALVNTGTLHGQGHVHLPGRVPGRQAARRRRRLHHGLLLRGAGRRGQRRPGPGQASAWTRCGPPRLRLRHQPDVVEGQVQGAVWMGMGQAISEQTATRTVSTWRPTCSTTPSRPSPSRRRSTCTSSRASTRTAPSAPRRPARARSPASRGAGRRVRESSLELHDFPLTPTHRRALPREREQRAAFEALNQKPRVAKPRRNLPKELRLMQALGSSAATGHCRPTPCARRAASIRPARFLAGGTDLVPNMRRNIQKAQKLIDLGGLAELREMRAGCQSLRIGAGVTLEALCESEAVRRQARAAGAGPGRGERRRPDPSRRRHGRWQSDAGYALLCSTTRATLAPPRTKLHEDRRRHLPRRAEVRPLLRLPTAATWRRPCWCSAPRSTWCRPHGQPPRASRRLLPPTTACATWLSLAPDDLLVSVRRAAAAPAGSAGYEKMQVRGAIDFPLAGVAVALAAKATRSPMCASPAPASPRARN